MSSKSQINLMKFTLSTGKIVHLREPIIADTETAAQVAGKGAAPDNQVHMGLLLQKELFKLLLVKVDNKAVNLTDKQQLDKLFKYNEYNQCLKAVKMVLGEDEGNAQLIPEFEDSGDK
jgi:hypothetical protein